jgi:ankyrin repeat protein
MRVTNGIPLGFLLFLPVHIVNCVQTLKADPNLESNLDDETPLHIVSEAGWLEVAALLLAARANPNLQLDVESTTPVYLAAAHGHSAMVALLLENNGDPSIADCFGDTPLLTVSTEARTDVLKVLLAPNNVTGGGGDSGGVGSGGSACSKSDVVGHGGRKDDARVRLVADPNQVRSTDGASGLFLAAQDGHLEVVKVLLRYKADPNKTTTDTGDSPLQMAVQEKHPDVAELLLEHRANPNHASSVGATPLHLAAQLGDVPSAKRLLAAGADVNALRTDKAGGSVLISAAQNGHTEVVKLLLAAEADPSLTITNTSITALDVAERKGHTNVIALLAHLPGYQGYERL